MLRVRDLERSRRFFTEILGFPQVGRNDRGMLFFSTGVKDNHHMLAIRKANDGAPLPHPEQVGMEHVSFEVATFAELQEVYRTFKEYQVKIRHTCSTVWQRAFIFMTPTAICSKFTVTCPPKNTANPFRIPTLFMAPSMMNWKERCRKNQGQLRLDGVRPASLSLGPVLPREG